jgi:NAD(P)H dehydrogenase (quinone)
MALLVTGASGHLGRLIVEELLTGGVQASEIIATGRDLGKLGDLRSDGVAVRAADFADPVGLAAAFEGADRMVLVSTPTVGERAANHRRAIDAARQAGVSLIVYTSALNAGSARMRLAEEHRATEEYLSGSGVPFVILRNGWYFENYTDQLPVITQTGVLAGSAGKGRVSAAGRADYAAAAALALTQDGHAGAVYELGGDRAFTLDELAAAFSHALGRPVAYTDLPVERYADTLAGFGLPRELADVLADADAGLARGELYTASTRLHDLLERPTTSLADALGAALSRAL